MTHIPVLQKEILEYLDPRPNENFIDCTIGEAGHSLAILEKTGPRGKILGIDWNPEIIQNTKYKIRDTEYKNRLILVCDNFVNLKEIVKKQKFKKISGILFDLGLASWHLEESKRGFSFLRNEVLDMRYNPLNPLTAEKIVNYWSGEEIERILREYGEEQFAKSIAKEIINHRKVRPINNTFQLVDIIKKAVPGWYQHQRTHFATRTFQSLRIVINNELNNLQITLPQALDILKPGAKLTVISFHSLEDRIVKNFFSAFAKGYGGQERKLEILTKKPVRPSTKEINYNPRSRSAKLRAAEKI